MYCTEKPITDVQGKQKKKDTFKIWKREREREIEKEE